MTSATSPIILKWDPKSLEIRTLTVERLLEPLVTQVRDALNTLLHIYVFIVISEYFCHPIFFL
uniref:Catenin alpha 2 n=1 Tax=Microcebus murinus TaxID=30608 RepID=A0A8C5VNP2_MICMU